MTYGVPTKIDSKDDKKWHKYIFQISTIHGVYRSYSINYYMRPIHQSVHRVYNDCMELSFLVLRTTDRWNGRGTRRKDVWRQQQRSISKFLLRDAHLVHPADKHFKEKHTGKVMRTTAICFKFQKQSDYSAIFWEPSCSEYIIVHHYESLCLPWHKPIAGIQSRMTRTRRLLNLTRGNAFLHIWHLCVKHQWSYDSKWPQVELWDCLSL